MTRNFFYLLLFLFTSPKYETCNAAKILFFWGMGGYSHRISVWPLVERLAADGHKITFFSSHKSKAELNTTSNITEIVPENLYAHIGMGFDPAEIRLKGGVKAAEALWPVYVESGVKVCEFMTTDKAMLKWANDSSFDLVVVNGLFNDCAFAYAYKFNAPTIVYGTSSLFQWWGESYGIPEENYPEFHFHFPDKMTFFQEIWNTFTPLFWTFYRHWYYLPKLDSMVRPALNLPDMPPISELDQRTNLILVNTHFSEEYPRSLPPSVVPIGGMQCNDKRKPLPKNIVSFIERWDKGFIYFSLGTYIKIPLLPQRHQDIIMGAFKKFPDIGIIIKWNGGPVPGDLPSNVITAEWLAQQNILAHPKAKAFISHGGLLSTQEAIYHAVPIVVFPIFAEQDYNAQRIHSTERGIMLEISDVTEEKLENAIRDILTNEKYKKNMESVSRIFRDRKEHPADNAKWWVDFVLKYKNTSFLHPIGVKRTWYERRMLHIWGTVAVVSSVTIAAAILTIYKIIAMMFGIQKRHKPKQQ